MGIAPNNLASGRLNSIAASTASPAASGNHQKNKHHSPDVSKIKRFNPLNETEEERKKRLAAKTINFTCTIFARLVIIAMMSHFAWAGYIESGGLAVRPFLGIFVLFADLGRVISKMMTPGTK